jgi:hypothetical protein
MAKIINLEDFNLVRGTNNSSNLTTSVYLQPNNISNTLNFENKNGDNIVITPMELREYLSEFLTREINLYANETVKKYRDQLERTLDVQMSNIEGHINDKIIKMTEEIISTTTSRLINEEVNRRVDEKLRKIRKAIDESI